MFTGLIEDMGIVVAVQRQKIGCRVRIASLLSGSFRVGQSVAHDGICLTVVACGKHWHEVEVIAPTLEKTTAGTWQVGTVVNLERALRISDRLEGHLVQGHVDCTLACVGRREEGNTLWLRFAYPERYAALLIPEGSIALNGVSLTVAGLTESWLEVALIPHTRRRTNLGCVFPGMHVNAEFDVVARYLWRFFLLRYGGWQPAQGTQKG